MRLLVPALLLASACGSDEYAATENALLLLPATSVVPLEGEFRPLVPLVRARLDGHDALFLLDSGSGITSLEPGFARTLGLDERPYSGSSHSVGSDGRPVSFDSFAAVDRFELGELRIERLRIPLVDSAAAREWGWAGILGQDVIGRMPVLLDGARNQLHLLPVDADVDAISAYLRDAQIGDGRWAVLETEYRPCPYLPMTFSGEDGGSAGELEILIDTGATDTSFPVPVIEALGLEPTGTYRARSIAGEFGGNTYHLEHLGLFGLNVATDVQDTPLDHGLLGMNVLRNLVVVLDAPGGRLWLHHRETQGADAEREVSDGAPRDEGATSDGDSPDEVSESDGR